MSASTFQSISRQVRALFKVFKRELLQRNLLGLVSNDKHLDLNPIISSSSGPFILRRAATCKNGGVVKLTLRLSFLTSTRTSAAAQWVRSRIPVYHLRVRLGWVMEK